MGINRTALIEVYGIHGEHFVVSGPGMGEQGVELARDPEGLFDEAPFTTVWQQSAFQEGATPIMSNPDPIDLVLGFHIYADESRGMNWDGVESAFFGCFHPTRPATIVVTTDSGSRSLEVVKLEKTRQDSKIDPRINGYSVMEVTLRAPYPYWRGLTHTSTFSASTAAASGTVTVFNPTDAYMWLSWAATAPAKWTIPDRDWEGSIHANRAITTPTLRAGQDLTIDTYPTRETYTAANGSNIAGRFGGVDFLYPIPPHTPRTDLPVSYVSGSTGRDNIIQARMVEDWQRAAGGAGQW